MSREERRARRKAATKRKRARTATWKVRQEAAKALIGSHNLLSLADRAEVVAINRKRAANDKRLKKLPVLRHAHGPVPESVVSKLLD